jgi:hypothetical protein
VVFTSSCKSFWHHRPFHSVQAVKPSARRMLYLFNYSTCMIMHVSPGAVSVCNLSIHGSYHGVVISRAAGRRDPYKSSEAGKKRTWGMPMIQSAWLVKRRLAGHAISPKRPQPPLKSHQSTLLQTYIQRIILLSPSCLSLMTFLLHLIVHLIKKILYNLFYY